MRDRWKLAGGLVDRFEAALRLSSWGERRETTDWPSREQAEEILKLAGVPLRGDVSIVSVGQVEIIVNRTHVTVRDNGRRIMRRRLSSSRSRVTGKP